MACLKYASLHTSIADMGFFMHHFYRMAQGEWWYLFNVHAQPFMVFYAYLYRLFPLDWVPYLLLILQSGALLLPIVWLYRNYGGLCALAYGLYFPVWYNALFDFHMDHLAVPLLFAFFFLEKKGKLSGALACALALALVKEPFALQTAACGIYLVLIKKKWREGSILFIAGLAYFYLATHFLIPTFTTGVKGGLDSSAFSWMGNSLSEILIYLVTHPFHALWAIVSEPGKLKFLLYIFIPLGFLSLLRPGILILALPLAAISLLSSDPNYYGWKYHYTAGLVAPVILAFSEALPKAVSIWSRLKFRKSVLYGILIVCMVGFHIWKAPSPVSQKFWTSKGWSYHFTAYQPTKRDGLIKMALKANIPAEATTAISVQNTVNWNHLTDRKNFFRFPQGIENPHSVLGSSGQSLLSFVGGIFTGNTQSPTFELVWAEFVVIDLTRKWFIWENSCSWAHGKCSNPEKEQAIIDWIEKTKVYYNIIFQYDRFFIFQRKPDSQGKPIQ